MNVRTDALARDTASPLNQGMVYPCTGYLCSAGRGVITIRWRAIYS